MVNDLISMDNFGSRVVSRNRRVMGMGIVFCSNRIIDVILRWEKHYYGVFGLLVLVFRGLHFIDDERGNMIIIVDFLMASDV